MLRLRDVANQDIQFQAICGGRVSVSRSANGTTYIIESDTDHFRVFATIVTPSDLPSLFYWDDCSNYGWWVLEGYQQKDFEPGSWPRKMTIDELSRSEDLGEVKEVKPS